MQRALGIGYGRAARLIDFMAEDGIVGQYNGSQAREVLITLADWERMQGLLGGRRSQARRFTAKARDIGNSSPKRRNIVRPEPWSEESDADPSDSASDDAADAGDWASADDGASASDDDAADDAEYRAEMPLRPAFSSSANNGVALSLQVDRMIRH